MKLTHVVAAAALLTLASTTAGSAQTTLYACYVKNSGTVYRIKTPGAPAKCTGNAIEFSWNMEGQVGPQGPQGPQGPTGPSGWPGVVVSSVQQTVFAGQTADFVAPCGPGQVLLSGGYHMALGQDPTDFVVQANEPHVLLDGPDSQYGWRLKIKSTSASSGFQVVAVVYCRMAIN